MLTDRLSRKEKAYLKKIYFDPSSEAGFSTAKSLYYKTKQDGLYNFTLKEVSDYLKSLDTFTVFKGKRKSKDIPNRLYSAGLDKIWEADLIHWDRYAKENNNFVALLLVIDIFSRYMWFAKLKSTNATDLIDGFKKVLQEAKPRKCEALSNDAGTNFTSKKFRAFLESNNIKQITLNPPSHSNYCEIANKYIQSKVNKLFYHNQNRNWEDYIEDIIKTKNKKYHYGLKFYPDRVNKNNERRIMLKQYLPPDKKKKIKKTEKNIQKLMPFKFSVGQKVRIHADRGKFSHSYQEQWTQEWYIIDRRYHRGSEAIFVLIDIQGDKILGGFKTSELQEVNIPKNPIFKIAKVLSYKNINKKRYALISWYGWHKKFDSYILASSIKDYKNSKS